MAKVTAPLLSFGAGGQVAKSLVYATWKGQPYVRRHVIPANPQSIAQTLTRDTFSNANAIWKLMGALAISPWDRFAQGQVLTGRNAFVSSFVKLNRAQVDLSAMVFSPGAKGGLPADSILATPGVDSITLDFTVPTPPTGWTLEAAIGAAIVDGDPATITDFTTVVVEDVAAPFSVVLTGLTTVGLHHWGGWLRWAKPDGSIAYGPSLIGDDTPT